MARQRYNAAVERAKREGILDRTAFEEGDVQSRLKGYLETADLREGGSRKLIEETTRIAMDETIQSHPSSSKFPGTIGKRKNLIFFTDTHGNIMAQNQNTGTRAKIVDPEERIG